MKIAILNLTAGGMSGGYKKYLANMLSRMCQRNDIEKILCAYPKTFQADNSLIAHEKIVSVFCQPFSPVAIFPDGGLLKDLSLFGPDVIFIPMERYFRFSGVPVVNMVRNMLPLTYASKNPWHEKTRNVLLKNIARQAVSNAQRTIAVSSYVKEHLVEKWHVEPGRVPVIYHGVDQCDDQKTVRPVSIPQEWGTEFLFTAGSIDPYRGLEDIFEALFILQAQGVKLKMVIAGEARRSMIAYKHKIQKSLIQKKIDGQVCWAGFLTIQEMLWCYKNCTAFVSATRVEACPNIALEAMACGSVIISADNKPMPEFFKANAFYYPSGKAEYLAKEIKKVFALSADARRQISVKAKMRSMEFSWDQTAQKTMEELKKAVESFRGKGR